ncbi:hypothetical protein FE257_010757 [Aspergillus nanangensis]|uniref:Major facilitator superfamily (MFS) profile domain-containing protein n=1 Tax=Aspergillus nanangensis TaxID=2582783 RepID=A0AAD4CVF2_ASPNN|nr:hypothetical protein FE257_010757 [Aspergillus nanangensis]
MSDTKKEITSGADAEVGVGYNRPVGFADLANAGVNVDDARKSKALNLLADGQTEIDLDSPEAKRVLQKIDLHIMPLVLGIYLLQLLDKNSLSFAAIMGIRPDTNLTENHFGYLFGEIPAAFLMQRFPLAKYLGTMSMLWGIVVATHAACTNFGSLAAVRFLLGSIEVCTTPAIIYITSSWYTRSEQVTRVAIWYSTSGWAQVFGGFFAWAINQASHFRWQGLFIFYGALTFTTGMILFFFLAASPTDARWLSDDEKRIALERVRNNKTGPTIISGFGYDTNTTTLLSMAPGACAVVGTMVALVVAKLTNRTISGVYTTLLGCIGVVMMLTIPEEMNAARYGGYILTMQYPICILSVLAFITSGVGGSTKKIAFGASYQLGYAVGNISGPQTFRGEEAPHYFTAKYTMLGFLIFTIMLFVSLGFIHWYWNSRRDKREALDTQNGIPHEHVDNEEFADLTDFQLRSFRYPL